ncbi:MAG: hypothetical protein ACJ768_01085 [Gaiellaceae bacterium]
MIQLGKDPVGVPNVFAAANGALPAKSVYVLDGSPLAPQLGDGKKAVLLVSGAPAEFKTKATIGSAPTTPGTYITPADYLALSPAGAATIRKYRWRDTWRKIWSRGGRRLLLATFVSLVTAGVGFVYAFWGETGTSAATVAARSQAAVIWAAAPADQINGSDGDAKVRVELQRREREAATCLAHLRGDEAPKANVPGVKCEISTASGVLNKDNEGLITAALGLITAALAGTGLRGKFGFGKDPGDS